MSFSHSLLGSTSSLGLLERSNEQALSSASKSAFKSIETSTQLLGLATPASRLNTGPSGLELKKRESEIITTTTATTNNAIDFSNDSSSNNNNAQLKEGEIIRGLNVNDSLLPSRRHVIGQLLAAVDHVPDLQVSSAALRVLSVLAEAPQLEPPPSLYGIAPNRLVTIVREEPGVGGEAACIARFRRRLEREESENSQLGLAELLSPEETPVTQEQLSAFGLTNYIRLQIVNLLLKGVHKRSYNLSHLLLGFSEENMSLKESGCLSLIVDLLEYGLGEEAGDGPVLLVEHPSLGLLALRLIRELLGGPSPFKHATLEYLRHERRLIGKLAGWLKPGWADDEQMAELCAIWALDLHEALAGDVDVPYAIQSLLIDGLLSHDQESGELRLVSFVLSTASPQLLQEWSLLTCRILEIDGNTGDDLKRSLLQLQQSLTRLLPKLLLQATSHASTLEALLQLGLALSSLSLPPQITLQPELSPASRCLIYAILLKKSRSSIAHSDDQLRLLQGACRDALGPGLDVYADSLSTVALAFIQSQVQVFWGELGADFIPLLVSSLVADDAAIEDCPSVLLKWQAKWSLIAAWLSSNSNDEDDVEGFLQGINGLLQRLQCLRLPFLLKNGSSWRGVVKPVLDALKVVGVERVKLNEPVREAFIYQFSRSEGDEDVILGLLSSGCEKDDLLNANNKTTIARSDALLRHAVFDKLKHSSTPITLLEWLGDQPADCLKEIRVDFNCTGEHFSVGHLVMIARSAGGGDLGVLERSLWCIGRVLGVNEGLLGFRREAAVSLFPLLQSLKDRSRFCQEICTLIQNLFKEQL